MDWVSGGMRWASRQNKPDRWNPTVLIQKVMPPKKPKRKKG